MDWHTVNTRKQDALDNPDFTLDLKKYEIKKPKKLNPTYELKKQLAELLSKPILQILGQTKGFTEYDLKGLLTDSLAFKANSQARAWKIIKELQLKKKSK